MMNHVLSPQGRQQGKITYRCQYLLLEVQPTTQIQHSIVKKSTSSRRKLYRTGTIVRMYRFLSASSRIYRASSLCVEDQPAQNPPHHILWLRKYFSKMHVQFAQSRKALKCGGGANPLSLWHVMVRLLVSMGTTPPVGPFFVFSIGWVVRAACALCDDQAAIASMPLLQKQ